MRARGYTLPYQLEVEIRGLDVYDPTTGEIRSSSTGDIACPFIHTDHNGESFFIRPAYFTDADEPYAKLRGALHEEPGEEATTSPLARGATRGTSNDAPRASEDVASARPASEWR